MKTFFLTLWRLLIITLAILYAVSCNMTIAADGSKSFSVDAEGLVKVLSTK